MNLEFQPGAEPVPGYRLIRPRGAWEGAERWEATDPEGNRMVVRLLKLPRGLSDAERQGLQFLKTIRHPNVLPLVDFFEVFGLLALVTPSFEMTLIERLADCRSAGYPGLPRPELLRALQESAAGLDELNRPRDVPAVFGGEAVRHRDVRPENLVLNAGRVQWVDAGLTAVVPAEVEASRSNTPEAAWYAPPERYRGVVTSATDQYSLAAAFAHLRLGRPPFRGATVMEVVNAHLSAAPDLEGLPDAERGAVERALAKDPSRRWPTSSAFAASWAGSESPPTTLDPTNGAAPADSSGESGEVESPAFNIRLTEPMPPIIPVATAVAAAPKAASGKSKTAARASDGAVAKAKVALPKVVTVPTEGPAEEPIAPPSMIKGMATSLTIHALFLLVLALWYFAPKLNDAKAFSAGLLDQLGNAAGDVNGTEKDGGLDTPLSMPDSPVSALEPTPTASFTAIPTNELHLDPGLSAPKAAVNGAAGGDGMNLGGNVGQGNGQGFGIARFGNGGENIQGVEVKVGDPQFTLIWDTRADLDLHVLEPGGSHIYWENRNGGKGGELDVDDVDGFGPENVYWVQGQGPPGEYKWYIHYYGGLGGFDTPTRWKVRLKHEGKITIFQGKLNNVGEKSRTYSFKMEPPGAGTGNGAAPKPADAPAPKEGTEKASTP